MKVGFSRTKSSESPVKRGTARAAATAERSSSASPELVLSDAERTVPPGPIEMETTGSRPLAESADGRIHAA